MTAAFVSDVQSARDLGALIVDHHAGCCALRMFTVYAQPRDFPEHYVVRAWHTRGQGQSTRELSGFLFVRLDALRMTLEDYGLARIERDPDDDPAILEVWL